MRDDCCAPCTRPGAAVSVCIGRGVLCRGMEALPVDSAVDASPPPSSQEALGGSVRYPLEGGPPVVSGRPEVECGAGVIKQVMVPGSDDPPPSSSCKCFGATPPPAQCAAACTSVPSRTELGTDGLSPPCLVAWLGQSTTRPGLRGRRRRWRTRARTRTLLKSSSHKARAPNKASRLCGVSLTPQPPQTSENARAWASPC